MVTNYCKLSWCQLITTDCLTSFHILPFPLLQIEDFVWVNKFWFVFLGSLVLCDFCLSNFKLWHLWTYGVFSLESKREDLHISAPDNDICWRFWCINETASLTPIQMCIRFQRILPLPLLFDGFDSKNREAFLGCQYRISLAALTDTHRDTHTDTHTQSHCHTYKHIHTASHTHSLHRHKLTHSHTYTKTHTHKHTLQTTFCNLNLE